MLASPGTLLADWPDERSISRRSRRPAAPKPVDPPKTVKPTPRGKYGLPPKRPGAPAGPAAPAAARPRPPCPDELYAALAAAGNCAASSVAAPSQRPLLFGGTVGSGGAVASPGLRRKTAPALRSTRDWVRLQRRVLPRYLFALDDVGALQLLRALVRLQPLAVPAGSDAAGTSSSAPPSDGAAHDAGALQQQLRQLRGQLLTAPGLASRISGAAMRGRHAAAVPAVGGGADADSSARARGFAGAADERRQFETMVSAALAVFAPQLARWDAARVVQLMGLAAQLHVRHDAFLQAWLAATAARLAAAPMRLLLVAVEGLAGLGCQPSASWLQGFAAASEARLLELSLQQLALLLHHLTQLQPQMPESWWQQYSSAVMQHVAAAGPQPGSSSSMRRHLQQRSHSQQRKRKQEQEQPLAELQLSAAAADALCSILCCSSQLGGAAAALQQPAWLGASLQALLPAVQQGRCSAGAALQLLAACSLGACQQLPEASHSISACLALLQQRLAKLASPPALQLLVACLRAPALQQQLPPGLLGGLQQVLAPQVAALPPHMLVAVLQLLADARQPLQGAALSAWALATADALPGMAAGEVLELLRCCAALKRAAGAGTAVGGGEVAALPSVWLLAVLQELQRRLPAPGAEPGGSNTGLSSEQAASALVAAQELAADWSVVASQAAPALQQLRVHAARAPCAA